MDKKAKARWLKQLHQWHWVSSALCLVCMVLFSVTGITLNHAAQIDGEPKVEELTATLPEPLLAALNRQDQGALPQSLRDWLSQDLDIGVDGREAEWSGQEVYLAMPRAGGDAWLAIDRSSGKVLYENTDRGWIAFLNDLHKGRDTGTVWRWFIDIFAVATLLFAFTGLALMFLHARRRPATWPVTALGLVLPWLLIAFFMH
ncbi:MAG: PepSY-associated TM helix domain-containing protein [Alcanivorax sp.]|nr:PepSY-associated TM helix domain-containing protein [Alcanivorax sp.]